MSAPQLTVTILGCGTSVGVPALGRAGWGDCNPDNPKNRRQRCALLVQSESTTVLVDAGPDIRNQLIPFNLTKIDALLITHTHADHIAGLDDIRTFFWPDRVHIPVYATTEHGKDIVTRYPYLFSQQDSSPSYFVPPLIHQVISAGEAMRVGDIDITIMHQDHGNTFSLGFIFNGLVGYSTDVVGFPDDNFKQLENIPYWIVEALRTEPHQAHSHLAQTLEWIEKVQPQKAYLTHLGLEADYDVFNASTPDHVEPAFDGLSFRV